MTPWIAVIPVGLQALAMLFDEGWYHRRRGLPRWERIGHPLDTFTVAACYAWAVFVQPGAGATTVYVVLAAFSCLFITKDEPVHAVHCKPGEAWLHSVLFVLHPIVLGCMGVLWHDGGHTMFLGAQLGLTLALAAYQVIYWRFIWSEPCPSVE
ncbi:MAG: hypothetical protein ABI321_13495 [Polyangia bacterium]